MQMLRKVLFYVFVLLYFILCPLTMLYGLGYLFDPKEEKGLVKTGLVYLSSEPPGATVYIGGKKVADKTPTVLRDLVPGQYAVTLSLAGHEDWSRTLSVGPAKATVIEHVLLFPEALKVEKLSEQGYQDLLPVTGDHFFLLVKGETLKDLLVYDWKDESQRPLLPMDSIYSAARVVSTQSVPDSNHLFLKVSLDAQPRYLWLKVGKDESEVEDVTHLFSQTPDRVTWDAAEKNVVFNLRAGGVDRLNLASKSLHPGFAGAVRAFGLSDKHVYFLDGENRLKKGDTEGKYLEEMEFAAALTDIFNEDKVFYRIYTPSEDALLFLGENGRLLMTGHPHAVDRGVRGVEIFKKTERALFWTAEKLGAVDFYLPPDEAGTERPTVQAFYAQGRSIRQAFWVKEGSHVLFNDGDALSLMDAQVPGQAALKKVCEVQQKTAALYLEDSGSVYFLEKGSGYLCKVRLWQKGLIGRLAFKDEEKIAGDEAAPAFRPLSKGRGAL